MFKLSFTAKDLVRAGWAFLAGVIGYVALHSAEFSNVTWKPFVYGAVVAGLVSIKNLLLADGTTVKG